MSTIDSRYELNKKVSQLRDIGKWFAKPINPKE
jgi:hypothetical protein